MTARLVFMFCFGTAHCHISRPVWFPTLAECRSAHCRNPLGTTAWTLTLP